MRLLRWLALTVLTLVGVGFVLWLVAPYTDGPIGPFPGGALAGSVVTDLVDDWGEVTEDAAFIQVQTRPADPYSVTIEAHPREGRLYSWSAWEHTWNSHVLTDPRVVVRIDGRLYERRAVSVRDARELALLNSPPGEVPDPDAGVPSGVAFRFDPR